MAERPQSKQPQSLEALLSANREQFDSLFERQMKAALPPLVPARRPAPKPAGADRGSEAQPQLNESQPSREPQSDAPSGASHPSTAPDSRSNARLNAGLNAGLNARLNVKAELNRRYTFSWSSEILDHEIHNGRAIVRCRLKVGESARVETGSSRIGEHGDQEAAIERAYEAALQKCADYFAAARDNAGDAHAEPVLAELPPAEQARRALAQARPLDAIAIDQVQTALINICQEMHTVWERGAASAAPHSNPIGSTLIADAHGRMLAGGLGSYVAHMLEQRALRFAPGDVLLQSDSYLSGGAASRVGDWLVLIPAFAGADLVGFCSIAASLSDVGGAEAGSAPVQAHSVFSEGTRIPPIKIFAAGELNETALQVILNNCRTPQANRADLLALVAACRTGAARLTRLSERFGRARYQGACAALLERTNQAMRRSIRERIPEEPQSFEDQIDDDGCGNGPFKLKLTVWREDDHAYFDWTGSSAQAPGPINLALHVGLAKLFVGMLLARELDPSVHGNDGFHELIHVTLPAGSILNPRFPAAIGCHQQVLARLFEVMTAALARHRPEALTAAGSGASASLRYGGIDAGGARFALIEQHGLSSRALLSGVPIADPFSVDSRGDGADGASRVSIESVERAFPVVIESCASIADTGGAGLIPGANGAQIVYRVLAAGEVSLHDDRHASRPWGVNGGKPGASSEKWRVRTDGTREALPAKLEHLMVGVGERIVFRTAGAGGNGDPLERDPALVREDVSRGLLTMDAAAAEYGVVLNGSNLEVDARATREVRDRLRQARKPPELFDRGEPP